MEQKLEEGEYEGNHNYKIPVVNPQKQRRRGTHSTSSSASPRSRRSSRSPSSASTSRSLSPTPKHFKKPSPLVEPQDLNNSVSTTLSDLDQEDAVYDENGERINLNDEGINELISASTELLKKDEKSALGIPLPNMNGKLDSTNRNSIRGSLEGGLGNGNDGENNLNIQLSDINKYNKGDGGGSSLIDINSNCCSFTSSQQNVRRIAINLVLLISAVTTMAGVFVLLFKKNNTNGSG